MVFLGFGKYIRADRIFGVEPLPSEDRGSGARTRVWVEGIPQPDEIQACEPHLWKKVELIGPRLICTLGNFATKLLSGRPNGITQVHGRPQDVVLGGSPVTLYPIFHPAAALYTPRMLQVLQEDFARIPELLGRAAAPPEPEPEPAPAVLEQPVQLGLF
jgi:DNA polymerase